MNRDTVVGALFVGAMSGTSLDGVDAALVQFNETGRPTLVHAHHHPYTAALRQRLLAVSTGQPVLLSTLGGLDIAVAQQYALAVLALLHQAGVAAHSVQAVGAHGQTVHHQPVASAGADPAERFSMQLMDPNHLAVATGLAVVADFRRRDMALGGQGAPLAPGFHDLVLRHPSQTRVVLNCGGIANISVLTPQQACLGYDTGPANLLMDGWAQQHLGLPFDADGAWAAQGALHTALLLALLADPYFAAPAPKSTGREHFNSAWLQRALSALPTPPSAVDVQRTLLELSASSVAQAVAGHANEGELLVCGGGARNGFFMQRLRQLLPTWSVAPTDTAGVPAQWMEAMAFASFAQRTLAGLPSSLPSVTGASRACVLGGLYCP
jgi:anhydro-N-acetylmuramic acid kinase